MLEKPCKTLSPSFFIQLQLKDSAGTYTQLVSTLKRNPLLTASHTFCPAKYERKTKQKNPYNPQKPK
jgi:hypothetical protein